MIITLDALQKIIELSSGNPCEPIYSIHAIAVTALDNAHLNERKHYLPKGGMCLTCTKLRENCSTLHFENMPIIGTTKEGLTIVRCTEHLRHNAE